MHFDMIVKKHYVRNILWQKFIYQAKNGSGMPHSISFDHRGPTLCPFDSIRRLTMRFNDGFSSDGLCTYIVYAKSDVRFF